jgi:spermidine/putrescine transport system permease protein
MVRFSVTPKVNAISTLLLAVTVLFTFLALRLQARSVAGKP